MKIQFVIVGWHYNQMDFYNGLSELEKENDFIEGEFKDKDEL